MAAVQQRDHEGSRRNTVQHSSMPRLTDEDFATLREYIEGRIGIKMPPAKRVMLESRLLKRIRTLQVSSFSEYIDLVFNKKEDAGTELVHMIDAVTTNKTEFFREPEHFRYLANVLLPDSFHNAGWGRDGLFKLWSCASSSGEEVYTLAMVLQEFAEGNRQFSYKILGTDISNRMLDRCRDAVYPEERIEPVPERMRKKYLLRSKDKTSKLVKIRPELRQRTVFHRVNLMDEDYGIRDSFHVIFCRNVIIYFERERQLELMWKLYSYLVPGGYLFLGHSETLAGMNIPLRSVAPTVYRKE